LDRSPRPIVYNRGRLISRGRQEDAHDGFGGAIKPLDESPEYKLAILGVPFRRESSYLGGGGRTAGHPDRIDEQVLLRLDGARGEPRDRHGHGGPGDVDTSGDPDKTFGLIEKRGRDPGQGRRAHRPGRGPFDHLSVIKAFARKFKPSISSTSTPIRLYDDLYGDRLSHACPFARILEDGLAANLVQVGVRP